MIRDLDETRKEIDKIDAQIMDLFLQRMACAKDVALYKQEHHLPIFVSDREQALLQNRLASIDNADAETQQEAARLFQFLMDLSKEKQMRILDDEQEIHTNSTVFSKSDIIAYQGLQGANQEQATIAFFGKESNRKAYPEFRDVFDAVKNSEATYGVVPIENSTAGSVFEIYDLLGSTGCYIVGEQNLSIQHALMAKANTGINDIKKVFSHPQALRQCENFLNQYDWELIPYSNTATAAQYVSQSDDVSIAAIASPRAAECYGLQILQSNIQDRFDNVTRFVIIANHAEEYTGYGKVSIMFTLSHKSGSLYKVLQHFAQAKLNLTKIESRVIPSRSFEYRFYMDFEGNISSNSIQKTIQELKGITQEVKVLGAYHV